MSPTEKLMAMLDECGVEYDWTDRLSEIPSYQSVSWWFNTADRAEFKEYHDGSTQLVIHSIKTYTTPAQAIAATLGDADATATRQDDADERNSKLFEAAKKWMAKAAHFEAENSKLRELVQDYHRYEHEDCYACRYINECRADESGRCIAPMRLGERYRELGIEVDDVQQRDV